MTDMNTVKFSIIVPVYKVEEYLVKCIDSILNQTYKDFELILVDDGSPDNCPAICDEYAKKDNRITVIHKQNGGVSSARNEGIKIAKGEFIWFVDSDDYIETNALEILSDHIERSPSDLYVFEQGISKKINIDNLNNLFYDHYFKYHFGFAPWNKIYKNSILQSSSLFFDTEETVGEDLLFNVNYYTKINSLEFLDENLYHYVIRENSAMTTFDDKRYQKQMRLFFKIHNLLEDMVSSEVLAILFLMHLMSGLNQSFKKFNLFKFRKIIKEYLTQTSFDKKTVKQAIKVFLSNENASFLGKIRIKLLFCGLM